MNVTFFNDNKDKTIVNCELPILPRIGDQVRLLVDDKETFGIVLRIIHNIGNVKSDFDASIQKAEQHVEVWIETRGE
jgi:hypothetical protein